MVSISFQSDKEVGQVGFCFGLAWRRRDGKQGGGPKGRNSEERGTDVGKECESSESSQGVRKKRAMIQCKTSVVLIIEQKEGSYSRQSIVSIHD